MAERRMFAKTIIDSDAFLDLPASTQLLYFQLGMRADDDGFINNPKMIMRVVRASDDDINMLIAKKFILPFENGVVVIKHWKINNYIQSDRYNPTKYKDLLEQLTLDDNKAYQKLDECIHDGYITDTQVRLDKVSIGKDSKGKNKDKQEYGEFKNVLLTVDEHYKLEERYPYIYEDYIERLSGYIAQFDKRYKSHYATILNWINNDEKKKQNKGDSSIELGTVV